jgi:hypothetical protein
LALALALGAGSPGAAPNQQGALALISQAPLGKIAVAAAAVGLLAYAIWKFVQGIRGYGPEGGGGLSWKDRAGNIGGGMAYVIFFAVAVRVLTGTEGNSSAQTKHAAGGVLSWPGGPVLVGAAGVALIAISAYQAYDAIRGRFAEDSKTEQMSEVELELFIVLGLIGLVARALVFALIGYFLVRTAIEFNPAHAAGVDGALAAVRREPYGPWLLGLVAGGLLTFSLFSLLEGRYRQL